MAHKDPWERAAQCECAAQAETNPERRETLAHLRDLWIALANEQWFLNSAEYEQQVEAISRVEADVSARTLH
jgi:ribosomal protein L20